MKGSVLGLGISVGVLALATLAERDAAACGGCFHPPTQTASDITDERMLLSVSTTQTTLYDQIRYSGSPTSFAWVLPIHGTVDVGLSADVLFDSIDVLTQTTIIPPESTCAPPPVCGNLGGGTSAPGAFADAGAEAPPVTVIKQGNVGPYATVQLQSTDPNALNAWLQQNGFNIPADVTPVVDEYVKEGFNFLAMKLLPNQGVQAMRPVRVTSQGASLSLPLRMAAVGTGATVGISIWVVADGRYEPQNFPYYHIDDSALVWDWSQSISNYTTLRAQNEATLGGKGWEIESSIDLNEQLISSVIQAGGRYYGGGFGGPGGGAPPPTNAGDDYLPVGDPDAGADAGPYQSADQVRAADIAALFAGMAGPSVRVTRVRSDISHAAMTTDLVFQASADQSEVSNQRNVTKSVNEVCTVYPACPSDDGGSYSPVPPYGVSPGGPGGTGGNPGSPGTGSGPTGSSHNVSCDAASHSAGNDTAYGTLAGLVGLVFARSIRSRRRGAKRAS